MKYIFLIIATGLYFKASAQFDFTAELHTRSAFYVPGANEGSDYLRKAGIYREAAYEMIYDKEGEYKDSLLVYYAEYDSFGNLLTSVKYDGDVETIYKYSNFYRGGRPIKRHSVKIVNGVSTSNQIIQYDEAGKETYLYVYQPGEEDPTVYKKQYDKKGVLQYLWEADPVSKRFSMLASYQYLSNGDLRKITRFPSYRKRFKIEGKVFYFKWSKDKDLSIENITDEYGQDIVAHLYNKEGRNIGKIQDKTVKELSPELHSFQPVNVANKSVYSGANIYGPAPNSYNAANAPRITALTDRRNISNENLRPVAPPHVFSNNLPGHRRYLTTTMRTSVAFNDDATINNFITKNEAEIITQRIHYYYNEKAIIH